MHVEISIRNLVRFQHCDDDDDDDDVDDFDYEDHLIDLIDLIVQHFDVDVDVEDSDE
jgi:hypothetical protein